jgi:hypothetical protein
MGALLRAAQQRRQQTLSDPGDVDRHSLALFGMVTLGPSTVRLVISLFQPLASERAQPPRVAVVGSARLNPGWIASAM